MGPRGSVSWRVLGVRRRLTRMPGLTQSARQYLFESVGSQRRTQSFDVDAFPKRNSTTSLSATRGRINSWLRSGTDDLLLAIHRSAAARLRLALKPVGADVLDFPLTAGWTQVGVGHVIPFGSSAQRLCVANFLRIVPDLRKRGAWRLMNILGYPASRSVLRR